LNYRIFLNIWTRYNKLFRIKNNEGTKASENLAVGKTGTLILTTVLRNGVN